MKPEEIAEKLTQIENWVRDSNIVNTNNLLEETLHIAQDLLVENMRFRTNIKMALGILERWGGYQDRIIKATEILKNLEIENKGNDHGSKK